MLRQLLKNPQIGKMIVPIIPDEGRTFGMESIIRQVGIYASQGQLYKPHDQDMLLYYREEKNGQILEEGITEAGSMASFTAAGTAYFNYKVPMIPFFTYYSMFGFQRVGDMIWAFADARGQRLPDGRHGGTHHADRRRPAAPGRTQPGALQHGSDLPQLRSRVRVRDRRHRAGRHAPHVSGRRRPLLLHHALQRRLRHAADAGRAWNEGILRGIYKFRTAANGKAAVQLFGSGPILNEALRAQEILAEKYGVGSRRVERHQLQRTAARCAGHRALEPPASGRAAEAAAHSCRRCKGAEGPIVAATDYMKAVPDQLAPWLRGSTGHAGHRWLRTQRQSSAFAAALRGECRIDCGVGAVAAGA